MNKYLERCAIEQTGVHSLCDIPSSAKRDGTNDDIHLLKTYYGYALTRNPSQEEFDFLSEFMSNIEKNLIVYQTRDCQILETGNHYVRLVFETNLNTTGSGTSSTNTTHYIKFYMKFQQNISSMGTFQSTSSINTTPIPPTNDGKLNIIYKTTKISSSFNQASNTLSSEYNSHITLSNGNIQSSKTVGYNYVDLTDDLNTKLPVDYLIPNTPIVPATMPPDACVVS